MIPLSRDVFHKANCDDGCRDLADMLGWKVRIPHTNVAMFVCMLLPSVKKMCLGLYDANNFFVHLMNCEIFF